MIDIKELDFSYDKDKILNNINYKVKKGKFLSILGPNGSGKSTLLKNIAGLLDSDNGDINILDKNIKEYEKKELAKIQAYVSQRDEISFQISVSDTVLLGRRAYINWSYDKKDYKICENLMEFLEIDHYALKKLNEISGGERQRVMIARALAQQSEVLLLDEPTSALDIKHQLYVMDLLRFLCDEICYTIIIVMHDLNLAYNYSDEIILLKDGNIFASGSKDDVLTIENIKDVYQVDAEKINTGTKSVFVF